MTRAELEMQDMVRMLGNCTVADLQWWANFSTLRRKVLVYLHDAKSVRYPSAREVPWYVIWLLARHHRKFIFCGGKRVDLEDVRRSVSQFTHKLKWRRGQKCKICELRRGPFNIFRNSSLNKW